jgi:DNA polymerase-3 subunit delta
MQVRPDQLEQSLQGQLKPAYLVSGDEPLQVMEALDAIRECCRAQDYLEREIFDIDKDFEWQNFTDEAAAMSLFSSRKIIELRMPTGKPGKQGSAAIKAYLQNPPEDHVLIISSGKLDGGSKNSAWFKAVEKSGVVVQCWPLQDRQLLTWLQQRFAAKGMQTDQQVLQFVSERVEGNLLAAAQEIDKLYLLLGPGAVTVENIQQSVADNSRYTVFELTDCALKGERQRVHKVLDNLLAEGLSPVLVTAMLAKEIRLLAMVSGNPAVSDAVLMRSGVWKNRLALFKQCLSRHSEKFFRSLLARCSRIDQITKGMAAGNEWDELRAVSTRLAARSRQAHG